MQLGHATPPLVGTFSMLLQKLNFTLQRQLNYDHVIDRSSLVSSVASLLPQHCSIITLYCSCKFHSQFVLRFWDLFCVISAVCRLDKVFEEADFVLFSASFVYS